MYGYSTRSDLSPKRQFQWHDLFKIIEQTWSINFKVQQINNKRSILFIFHAERLKIYYKANQNQENSSIGDKENNQQKES